MRLPLTAELLRRQLKPIRPRYARVDYRSEKGVLKRMNHLAGIGKILFAAGALMLAISLIMPLYYTANAAGSHSSLPDLSGYPLSFYSAGRECGPSANARSAAVSEFCAAIPILSAISLLGILLCVAGPALYAYSKLADLEGRSYSIRKGKR